MKKLKRIAASLLACAMIFSASACGGGGSAATYSNSRLAKVAKLAESDKFYYQYESNSVFLDGFIEPETPTSGTVSVAKDASTTYMKFVVRTGDEMTFLEYDDTIYIIAFTSASSSLSLKEDDNIAIDLTDDDDEYFAEQAESYMQAYSLDYMLKPQNVMEFTSGNMEYDGENYYYETVKAVYSYFGTSITADVTYLFECNDLRWIISNYGAVNINEYTTDFDVELLKHSRNVMTRSEYFGLK